MYTLHMLHDPQVLLEQQLQALRTSAQLLKSEYLRRNRLVHALRKQGVPVKSIAEAMGVKSGHVYQILRGDIGAKRAV